MKMIRADVLIEEHDVVHAVADVARVAVKPDEGIVASAGDEPTVQLRTVGCGEVHILEVHAKVVRGVGYLFGGEECQPSIEQVIFPRGKNGYYNQGRMQALKPEALP